MKNFPIDILLKTLTVCSYILVYIIVGYSAITVLPMSGKNDVTISDTTQFPSSTVNPTETPPDSQVKETGITVEPTHTQESVAVTNPTDTPDTRCLISVDGATYDVTQFRTIHDGGDIFTCGIDMTKAFYDEHDSRTLQKMQRYRI
jgi:cytochrome b involved in lipid metabolism